VGGDEDIPKRELAAAADLQPLLIRNCTGRFDPYVADFGGQFDVTRSLNRNLKLTLN